MIRHAAIFQLIHKAGSTQEANFYRLKLRVMDNGAFRPEVLLQNALPSA